MNVLIIVFLLVSLFSWILIPWFSHKRAGLFSWIASLLFASATLLPAIWRLSGTAPANLFLWSSFELALPDALSAWFILIINVVFIAGSFYGMEYLSHYPAKERDIRLHWSLMPVFQFSMVGVCWVTDWFSFLVLWEIMSFSSFLLILFYREEEATLKAALNYLIQMHISVAFLMTAVFLLWSATGSMEFSALSAFSTGESPSETRWLFLLFFAGFAIKSGFVPFHTWLPHAHPAAASHLSGILSGVIIKLGIYGILRVILNLPGNWILLGWLILMISLATALYGVMQAIVQKNLKRLLAYSSIEHIGIIGMGIGVGTLGLGNSNASMIFLGFGGALLHSLNHGLFKSLLFFTAGNLFQSTHTLNIEHLGGLSKSMPRTTGLFTIASLSACAIPPLNGFVSEFLIYAGFFSGILDGTPFTKLFLLLAVIGFALTGGMSIVAFTKATGITFLGKSRKILLHPPSDPPSARLSSLYLLAVLIFSAGLFPLFYLAILKEPLALFTSMGPPGMFSELTKQTGHLLLMISVLGGIFLTLTLLLYMARERALSIHGAEKSETWGCGYSAPDPRQQYTGASFVRIFRKQFHPIVMVRRKKLEIEKIFPGPQDLYATRTSDLIEEQIILKPLKKMILLAGRLRVFQNGQVQYYLLYGFVFILVVLLIEVIG